MKKRFLSITIVFLFLLCSVPVSADVIWEPADDFYFDNYDDALYVGREYYTNGEDGYVVLYETPKNPDPIGYMLNSELVYIHFLYVEGADTYGLVEIEYNDDGSASSYFGSEHTAWLLMDDMALKYDSIAFAKDHEDDFLGSPPRDVAFTTNEINYSYTYPGGEMLYENDFSAFEAPPSAEHYYIDEQDRIWGYVSYYYGMRDQWFCFDELNNSDITPKLEVVPDLIPAKAPEGDLPQAGGGITLVTLLVTGVCLLSLILIMIVRRKK